MLSVTKCHHIIISSKVNVKLFFCFFVFLGLFGVILYLNELALRTQSPQIHYLYTSSNNYFDYNWIISHISTPNPDHNSNYNFYNTKLYRHWSINTQNQFIHLNLTLNSNENTLLNIPNPNNNEHERLAPLIDIFPQNHPIVPRTNRKERKLMKLEPLDIGFTTDASEKHIASMITVVKSFLLHRPSNSPLQIHIMVANSGIENLQTFWLNSWENYNETNIPTHSFSTQYYDIDTYCYKVVKPLFHLSSFAHNASLCKIAFPYAVDPKKTPYLIVLDTDITITSHNFQSLCWTSVKDYFETHPLALFAASTEPVEESRIFTRNSWPVPYLKRYNSYVSFNAGLIIFSTARIQYLDTIPLIDSPNFNWLNSAYPVHDSKANIPDNIRKHRWLADLVHTAELYFKLTRSLAKLGDQNFFNNYFALRPYSFFELSTGCNFNFCQLKENWIKQSYIDLNEDFNTHPYVTAVHSWHFCSFGTENLGLYGDNPIVQTYVKFKQLYRDIDLTQVNKINPYCCMEEIK